MRYQGMNTAAIVAAVIADGVIDADEVAALREHIWADNAVDAGEFQLMTQLNDWIVENPHDDHDMVGFKDLYRDVTAAFVLEDDTSPGIVDQGEANTLMTAWRGDGEFDARERAAAEEIVSKTTGPLPANLVTFLTENGVAVTGAAAGETASPAAATA